LGFESLQRMMYPEINNNYNGLISEMNEKGEEK
jgi:hypothetical protein